MSLVEAQLFEGNIDSVGTLNEFEHRREAERCALESFSSHRSY